jgi:hypothetical protein
MAKTTGPLFGFSARGTVAKLLTFRRRDARTIAEAIPTHPDAKSPAQLGWRTMYEACSALWHTLTAAEKQTWESLARSRHMTGFALWQSQCLRPNPGIYLPLAGGTMSGDIVMASHKITGLPLPTLDPDAATKAYVDAAPGGFDPFATPFYDIQWLSLDSMYISSSGTYDITLRYPLLRLQTTAGAAHYAGVITPNGFHYTLTPPNPITTLISIAFIDPQPNNIVWLICSAWDSEPPATLDAMWGWKLVGTRLHAVNSDRAGNNDTDTTIDLPTAACNIVLKTIFTPGTDIKFYKDSILLATHNTFLDTDEWFALQLSVQNTDTLAHKIHIDRTLLTLK